MPRGSRQVAMKEEKEPRTTSIFKGLFPLSARGKKGLGSAIPLI